MAVLVLLVPAASAALVSSVSPQGWLTVQSDASESIVITCGPDANVKVNDANPDNGPTACAAVTGIQVYGYAGSGPNVIDLSGVTRVSFPNAVAGLCCVHVIGSPGADTITGSEWKDELVGGGGNDSMIGGEGDDFFNATGGSDRIEGGPGDDYISFSATDGDDTITAADGAGQLNTVQETDTYTSIEAFSLRGQGGNDTITTGSGGDTLRGGDGNDVLHGGAGRDFVAGDTGPFAGNLPPTSGSDVLNGGIGADSIYGESGNDEITSRDDSADSVSCGSDTDTVVADPLDEIDQYECETVDRGTPSVPVPTPPPPPPVIQPPVTPPPPPPPPPAQSRPRVQPRCVVPNVKGKTVARARILLSTRRCRLGRVGRAFSPRVKRGMVIFQSRRPGLRLARGTTVNVVVSRGRRG
jgi:RTX calcium-binding nonapeptide repeat (4 copies)/PASTA domain